MEYQIESYPDKKLLVVRTEGVATLEGLKSYTLKAGQSELWSSNLLILADHRKLDIEALSSSEVSAYRKFVFDVFKNTPFNMPGYVRAASVVSRVSHYSIVRQWEFPLKGAIPFIHEVFMFYKKACEWLGVKLENC